MPNVSLGAAERWRPDSTAVTCRFVAPTGYVAVSYGSHVASTDWREIRPSWVVS